MIKGVHFKIENQNQLDELMSYAVRFGNKALGEFMPNTSNALYEVAKTIEANWKGWTYGESNKLPIRDIPHPSEKLADSITVSPNESGHLAYEVYSEHPLMADYQNGKDETIDMKAPGSPWLNGKKSRVNKKDGSPYLIVPFSWGTPGRTGGSAHFRNVVPRGIMRALERREVSKSLGKLHTEPNVHGEEIPRDDYIWGGRITEDEARHTDSKGNLTGYDVGMVRMWDSSYGENGNHGNYFTFRVISAKAAANKWIKRHHVEQIDIERGLKQSAEWLGNEILDKALHKDFEECVKNSLQEQFKG